MAVVGYNWPCGRDAPDDHFCPEEARDARSLGDEGAPRPGTRWRVDGHGCARDRPPGGRLQRYPRNHRSRMDPGRRARLAPAASPTTGRRTAITATTATTLHLMARATSPRTGGTTVELPIFGRGIPMLRLLDTSRWGGRRRPARSHVASRGPSRRPGCDRGQASSGGKRRLPGAPGRTCRASRGRSTAPLSHSRP